MNDTHENRQRAGLAVGGLLIAASIGLAQAQSADETITLSEAVCASSAFAATISPNRIGEPVGAVVFDSIAWQAAAGN
jgi:hypothetical protein